MIYGHLKGRIRRQCRRIDHQRIRSCGQGRDSPGAIPFVAFLHLLENARIYTRAIAAEQLPVPPLGPGLQAGGYEKLNGRLGADHGADVPPIQNGPGRPALRPGRRVGGKPPLDASAGKVVMAKKLYRDKTNAIPEICRMLNISRATLYRYVKATQATT